MEPHSHPLGWIEAIGWGSLALGFASALVISVDILRGYRQKMAIMNLVYPITALYWGPVALWFYWTRGRRNSTPVIEQMGPPPDPDELPRWTILSKAVSHCGAGCTLGDIGGEWVVWALGWTAFGISLPVDFGMDFLWAWTLGIAFQYFTIVPMRDIGKLAGVWAAIKADTLSIVSFQAGLFGGMAIYQLLIWHPGLPKTTATYWMMMQLAMILGFFTALPVNNWLIRKGLKEKM